MTCIYHGSSSPWSYVGPSTRQAMKGLLMEEFRVGTKEAKINCPERWQRPNQTSPITIVDFETCILPR